MIQAFTSLMLPLKGAEVDPLSASEVHVVLRQVRILRHVDIVAPHHHRIISTRAPRTHGAPQGQPAARSEVLAPPEALAKDTGAKEHDAAKTRGSMPPAAIGTTPPTHHTCLTPTRAPRPHGTPQGQPAARSEALALPEALAKDTRAKEHDAAKARGPMPPAAIGFTTPTHHTRLTSTRAPRPHGTPQGQPAARSEALAPPGALAKDTRAKSMMRRRHEGPMPPADIGTTPHTQHTRLTSTRAPRPHGTPQGQPAARSKAFATPGALAKDSRAKNMRR